MFRIATLSATLLLATTAVSHAQAQPSTTPAAAQTAPAVPIAPVAEVQKLLAQRQVVVLDVRTPEEFATGHLTQAKNLDFRAPDFAARAAKLDPSKTYVLYCASGNRSGKAAVILKEKGVQKVVNAGAFKALQEGGIKTE
jgi:phage shock protein E